MASDEASGLDGGKRVSEETVASMEAEPQRRQRASEETVASKEAEPRRRQVAADAASNMEEVD